MEIGLENLMQEVTQRKIWSDPNVQNLKLWFGIGTQYHKYEFSQPPGSCVETYTSFYVFSEPKWLTIWVGYWTPTKTHHCSSASHHPTPPPQNHYLWHTIGNNIVSWFGAICPLWQAPVPFLNNMKLLISSCQRTIVIKAHIDRLKHVVMIQ